MENIKERFWGRVKVRKGNACWLWDGPPRHNGYGEIRINGRNGKTLRAHRVAWEIANGPIPEGLCVMHKCDNRICVRPDHLSIGTVADNQADMARKGRAKGNPQKGEFSGHHKLTEKQVLEIRKRFANGETDKHILGVKFGVTRQSIHLIVTRRQWSHI